MTDDRWLTTEVRGNRKEEIGDRKGKIEKRR